MNIRSRNPESDYNPSQVAEIARKTVWPALEQSAEVYLKFNKTPEKSKIIPELKSNVSALAMSHLEERDTRIEWIDDVLKTYNINPKTLRDRILVWYGEFMNPPSIQHLSGKQKSELFRKIDTSVSNLSFPEGTLAEWFEWDVWKIESEIHILQEKLLSAWVSQEQKQNFESVKATFRYGIHQFHSAIWSAYRGNNQQQLNQAIWFANKLITEVQLELAVLLHKFGISEVLHPHYQQKVWKDLTESQIREMFQMMHKAFNPFVYWSRQLAAGSKE